MKLKVIGTNWVMFWCPGCEEPHTIPVVPDPQGWGWNQSLEAPSFTPSIFVNKDHLTPGPACHSYVTAGVIQFLADSTHKLAGQSLSLPEIPEKWTR